MRCFATTLNGAKITRGSAKAVRELQKFYFYIRFTAARCYQFIESNMKLQHSVNQTCACTMTTKPSQDLVSRFQSDKIMFNFKVLMNWKTNLCQRHLRDDGKHNLFPFCGIRIFDVLDQPRLERTRRFTRCVFASDVMKSAVTVKTRQYKSCHAVALAHKLDD